MTERAKYLVAFLCARVTDQSGELDLFASAGDGREGFRCKPLSRPRHSCNPAVNTQFWIHSIRRRPQSRHIQSAKQASTHCLERSYAT
jgi:hypothetical protein